jgi:hypothetical protein
MIEINWVDGLIILQGIINLCKETSNDQELGEKIRQLIINYNEK